MLWDTDHAPEELGLVEIEDVLACNGSNRGVGPVDHLIHFVGSQAIGKKRGHDGACAGADVDVEVVDGAVDQQIVDGAQRADLIDCAGQSAAGEHEC